jgi:MoaA/NifB/PqqE/SkfB family radical SAM enzyme
MEDVDFFRWAGQAAAYRNGQISTVCFTGGEPFYDIGKLRRMSRFAASLGMVSTVVTNGFWAESSGVAREVLEGLPDIRAVSVSTDEHHLMHIPFARVENALRAARDAGLVYHAAVCTESESDPGYLRLRAELERVIERDRISTVITFPAGRALAKMDSWAYEMADLPPVGACPSASTPAIFPDGRIYACMGPVIDLHGDHLLLLGNLKERPLAKILDEAEQNLVLHIIRVWGPGKLLAFLQERGYGDRLPRRYVKDSICNLCYALMSDPGLCRAMDELARDAGLREKTAYARGFYLRETEMIERLDTPYLGKQGREGT